MRFRSRVRRPPRAAVHIALPLLLACCLSCSAGGRGSAATPVDGAPGAGDRLFPDAGNGGYHVTHYGLDLSYAPDTGTLAGTAVITARATEDLGQFDLDLTGMTVSAVSVDGRAAAYSRKDAELIVTPSAPLPTGTPFTVTVGYTGVPGTITDPDGSLEGWFRTSDGAAALGEPVGAMTWYPCDNHPSDKATYDLAVSVPDGLTAVSNGTLAATGHRAGRTVYHWHTGKPMASYLTTLAIGHFDVSRSTAPGGLPLYTAVDPRSDDQQTAAALARIPEIISWESSLFGPFPFASSGAIVEHLAAGQGGYSLETQSRPFFPGNSGVPAVRLTTLVHEMAHEWVGDMVTPRNWQDIWLNEGFATYTEWLWNAHEGDSTEQAAAQAAFDAPATWTFPPATPRTAADLFASPVYRRGALVLHELRLAMGDDAFFRMLRAWPAAHAYGNAATDDFTAFAARYTPHDLKPVFATWLYGKDKPAHL